MLKKINWKLFNLALWIELLLAYVLPFQVIDDKIRKVGLPISFVTVYNNHTLDVNPLMSMYFNPLSLLFDVAVIYVMIMFIYSLIKMKKKAVIVISLLCVLLCVGLALSRSLPFPPEENELLQADKAAPPQEKNKKLDTTFSPTAEELTFFNQVLLFLQEGLREHQIKETYTVYFPAVGNKTDDSMSLVLQDKNGYLLENITYRYDAAANWYTLGGMFEPVLTGMSGEEIPLDEEMQALLEDAIFHKEISIDTPLKDTPRFTSPQGPVLYDDRAATGYGFGDGSGTDMHLYLYQDDRLGFTAQIRYPQLFARGSEAEIARINRINQIIKDSFFYGYGSETNTILHPEQETNGFIERNYLITRSDDKYLSMRIYGYTSFRGEIHPNEEERGLTIDMETGDKIELKDIVENKTLLELLDTGTFHCLQLWGSGAERDADEIDQYQIATLRKEWQHRTLEDYNNYFYLTQDSLGLIDSLSLKTVCMEAKLSELGLNIFSTNAHAQ